METSFAININNNKDQGQHAASFTNESSKSEEELKHANNELHRQAAEMNALQREIAEMKEWKAQQEAVNQARLKKAANLLATVENGNNVSPSGDNKDQNSIGA